ncbi:MAG: M13 family metallopeptidase [Bacteroidales bacterium]|nr:M13 family metallopeptidase [Bacteroidales bacterium]
MKFKTVAAVLCCALFAVVSCNEPFIPEPSATDDLPFPIDVNRDLTTDPGDDFWQYCNGDWYAKTATPATGAVGGMYDQSISINEMVETIKKEDPSLKRYYQLSDELYAHSDEAMAYLMELVAKYPKPATREDCLRMFGKMIMDGITPIGVSLVNDFKEGQLVGVLAFPVAPVYQFSYSEVPDALKGDLRLITEGMGIDASTLYYNEHSVLVLSTLAGQSLDYLYSIAQSAWASLYPYVSEELNASLGSGAQTPDQVRQNARANLNYLISNRLAVKYVTPDLKQRITNIMEGIRAAYHVRMENLEWMSETTKASAIEKLEKMTFCVGSPDNWYEDCLPDLTKCNSLLEAVHKLMVAKTLLYKHLIGTNDGFSNSITGTGMAATGEMMVTDLTMVNSYYKREFNAVVILPALMVPPIVRTDYSEAYLYGVMVPVAHEITHAFDSEGSKYDAYGRVRNWWTVADKMAFEDEQAKLIQCYSTLEYDPAGHPGQYTDGAKTLAENIADLGGFLIACDAYMKRLQEQGFSGDNFDDQLRKFYEAYAHVYCMKYSDEKLNSIVNEDNHSHCRLRVNGVVMNTDLWYDLYDVDRNNDLYLPVERRTYIW